MKLTAQIKLLPTPEQKPALLATMEAFNGAANFASEIAYRIKTSSQRRVHHECYYEIRNQFGLPAQLAVRAIGKAVESYRADKKKRHIFKKHGAIIYDDRILRFNKTMDSVSIATLGEREKIPFAVGGYHEQYLNRIRGQADLVYRDGDFYLLQTVELPDPPKGDAADFLGVDLGIKNIAVDSDGETFSGGTVNGLRKRHAKLRARLQSKGTKSAKRLLKKRNRKEQRFAKNVNHTISKKLIAKAQGTERGVALENLKGIRGRITVRRAQRRQQHSWAFSQLRLFVEYKAHMAGILMVLVDPRNTSRTCPECGHISRSNRPSQAVFSCVACGFSARADHVAAENIRRAAVNQPDAEAAD